MRTVNSIRVAVLSQRRALGLSQAPVAMHAGVSRKWLSEFEQGKVTAEIGLVLSLLDSLNLEFSVEPKRTMPNANATPGSRTTTDSNGVMQVDLDQLLSEYQS